ncbi:ABC-type transport system involved in multi-copper enzyme maturation, permease component [Granulicatella balaenopterae]|uniref:ABC-type transport system involved in multi-copper enzyme maturation, permease component n=1 Tax=Granulicatella balaenopterae TaxID=137733 RepID=A0A1H9H9C8_9LACT|nr:ABC transporter permease [Granulicatella balaenopterae]SEQ58838.1 ABC-type transport system involved in multi-copper enzyme maturation, permease component [Granulicatella balaenopterae]
MLNYWRAEFYRLRYSKGFWINVTIFLLMIVVSVWCESVGYVGVHDMETMDQLANLKTSQLWTARYSLEAMAQMVSFLIFTSMTLFTLLISDDFSYKTYKNNLTVGLSRGNFLAAKYSLLLLVLALELLLFYVMVCLVSGLKNGFGELDSQFMMQLLKVYLLQYLNLVAIFSMGLALFYLFLSNVIALVGIIVITLASQFLVVLVPDYAWLMLLNFQAILSNAWQILPTDYFVKSLVFCLLVSSGCYVLSNQLLKSKSL